MKKSLYLLTVLTVSCLNLHPLSAQEAEAITGTEEYSTAYQETSRSAHWSAYVPLAGIIASAAFFGWADKQTVSSSRSSSYGGHHGHHGHHGHFTGTSGHFGGSSGSR